MDSYTLELDLNVLNHLGIGLYSNTPSVLTEIVANSWDADASEVHISIDPESDEIIIKDDGHGMEAKDIQEKFLKVGYARREHNEAITPAGRQCMGRKGIGKLAMFSLANEIHVVSRKQNQDTKGFIIDVNDLKNKISTNSKYNPPAIAQENLSSYSLYETGTTIVLRKLNKQINKTETYLRRKLARRFSVISDTKKFSIHINDSKITLKDRGFYQDIQFLWTFGSEEQHTKDLCSKHVKHRHFDGVLAGNNRIKGFIGSVVKPEMLKKDDDNNNTITLMANGRIFVEDVQKNIDDSKVFNSYLVGEIQADFFDDNNESDMAVSSRQNVNENDDRYTELVGYIKSRLSEIGTNWTDWRREIGSQDIEEEFPKVKEWYATLKKGHQTLAKKLIGRTATIRIQGNEDEQRTQRRELIKHQILAFQKLAITDNLHLINSIDIEKNVSEFREVLLSIEDIEASMHHEIVEQRLAVLRKLKEHAEDKVKERVVQEHVYDNLWLIDPTYSHVSGSTVMEETITQYLQKVCPETDEGARIDIAYKTTSGKYLVIEMKKPGKQISFDKLRDQGQKYFLAMNQYFRDNPGSRPIEDQIPIVEIILLVDKNPTANNEVQAQMQLDQLKSINAQIRTYKDLINQAERAYNEEIKTLEVIDKVKAIIDGL